MDLTTLVFIDAQGYHFADFPTFLQAYQSAYQGVYGSDTYLGADSQDGQWVTIQAQATYDMAAVGASVYNSFSPATAQGAGLARVVKINGINKGIATKSSVVLTIVGSNGTVILNGVAIDSLEQQWNLPASVTIPGSGTINVTATAANAGNVTASPGTITTIFTPTLGWQSVNNAASAVAGNPVETDGGLRIRQQNSTALPAQTLLVATQGALSNLVGVTGVRAYENDSETTDGNGLPAHSVCFVVNGGANLQTIANVIGLYKTQGTTTTTGSETDPTYAQSETYTDSKGMPVTIKFISPARPATINVQLSVTALTAGWSTDFIALIQASVAAFVQNGSIGGIVIFTELYLPAYLAGTSAQGTFSVSALMSKKNAGSYGTSDIDLAFDEVSICDAASNVHVTVL